MQTDKRQRLRKKANPKNGFVGVRLPHDEHRALQQEAADHQAGVSGLIYLLLREEYPLTFKQIVGKWRARQQN